jgi:ectoine hydroxylase-related dioxygenase (phytanoyl-CoA dioxygenase family)
VIGWALEPGDAVCFHMLTLHAAGGVSGTHRRRVLSLRFLGDDMVHAVREWDTSPPFPGLADELPDGAPLDHPLFPIVWSRAG